MYLEKKCKILLRKQEIQGNKKFKETRNWIFISIHYIFIIYILLLKVELNKISLSINLYLFKISCQIINYINKIHTYNTRIHEWIKK